LLVGFDNEKSVANTAMMNMSVHGDGSVGIYNGNSLLKEKTRPILKPNSFDCIVTNPPFSVNVKVNSYKDIDGKDVLENYDFGHSYRYNKKIGQFEKIEGIRGLKNQDSKILFIERCHGLLKNKKYLGIVLDDGVLNNPSDAYVRDWIYNNFIVKAVISLPFEIFRERGATNRTSVMILQKKEEGMLQGDVFMAIARHAGETFGKLGWKMRNDLETIYQDWKKYINDEKGSLKFSFVVKKENLENYYDEKNKVYQNRLDPKYYNPYFRKLINKIEKNKDSDFIDNLVKFEEEKCPEDDINSFGSKYIKKITKHGEIEFGEINGINDPKGEEDRIFRAGDLVASRINIKSGMIAFVSENLDEIRATSEYYKFVPIIKDEKARILKKYLFIVLTSRPIQIIMDAIATGQYMRLKEEELAKINMPEPAIKEQQRIIKEYENEKERAFELIRNSEEKIESLNNQIEKMILNGED